MDRTVEENSECQTSMITGSEEDVAAKETSCGRTVTQEEKERLMKMLYERQGTARVKME